MEVITTDIFKSEYFKNKVDLSLNGFLQYCKVEPVIYIQDGILFYPKDRYVFAYQPSNREDMIIVLTKLVDMMYYSLISLDRQRERVNEDIIKLGNLIREIIVTKFHI